MKKELTLYFPPGWIDIELAPVEGKYILDYLDHKYQNLLNDYIKEVKMLARGGCYDRL